MTLDQPERGGNGDPQQLPDPPPVPEPATLALLGGALAVALARRKTRSKP